MLFAIVVGIPLGLISAYRRNSPDRRRHDDRSPTSASRCRSSCSACCSRSSSPSSLKDTPFALPPSGRLSSGVNVIPLAEVWGLKDLTGPPRGDPRLRLGHLHLQRADHRPVGRAGRRPPAPDPAGHRARHDPAGDHRPDHPLQPARGARPRLRPDGAGQGPRRARASSSATPLRNALLPVVTIIGLQLGALLSGAVLTETIFNLAGRRADAVRGDHRPRLRRDPGLHADHRRHLRGRQPDRRRLVRLPRPADPARMSDQPVPAERRRSAAVEHDRARRRPASLWRDTLAQRPAPALGRRRAGRSCGLLVLVAIFAPLIATHDPNQSLLGRRGRASRSAPRRASTSSAARPTSRSTCSAPTATSATCSAASSSARGCRCRSASRRSASRSSSGPSIGAHRRLRRRLGRQRPHAPHGRPAGLPVAAPGDRHRHRARAEPDQRPARHRHRVDPDLCPRHARVGALGHARRTSSRRRAPSASRRAASCSAGSCRTR